MSGSEANEGDDEWNRNGYRERGAGGKRKGSFSLPSRWNGKWRFRRIGKRAQDAGAVTRFRSLMGLYRE